MNQYNMLQAIVMSFYSKKLYRDVAINWGGKAFLYLALLMTLSWLVFTAQTQILLNTLYAKNSGLYVAQIPVLTIKDGKLSTPENRPYIITDPDSHETIAVIDTSGQYTTIEQAKATVLMTESAIISQPKPTQTRVDQFPQNFNATLSPEVINGHIQHYLGYFWIPMLLVLIIGSYIYRVLQALLYAIIGKIFNAMYGTVLSYGQVLQIALVAITPVIVVSSVLDACHVVLPLRPLLCFILAMVYLFFGIAANKKKAVI